MAMGLSVGWWVEVVEQMRRQEGEGDGVPWRLTGCDSLRFAGWRARTNRRLRPQPLPTRTERGSGRGVLANSQTDFINIAKSDS